MIHNGGVTSFSNAMRYFRLKSLSAKVNRERLHGGNSARDGDSVTASLVRGSTVEGGHYY